MSLLKNIFINKTKNKDKQEIRYYAFISYSSKDTKWGKRLQRKLEGYRLPTTLCSEHGWSRTPINPVFLAATEIQPGGLTEEIQSRLSASRNLVVICSPNSARSKWVGKEIEFFHNLGRTKQIYFFIVDGIPHSGNPETECFNPVVDTLGLPEILGANIHENIYQWSWLNKERAYVQLISKLLGVEFDDIWQRHRRLLVQKTISWIIGSLLVLAALICVYINNLPIDVEVRLNEATFHNSNLPPMKDAIVTMILDNEVKVDTISSQYDVATFTNVPHFCKGKNIRMRIDCRDFIAVDTTVILANCINLDICRNPLTYGQVHFQIRSIKRDMYIKGVTIEIEGYEQLSDDNGTIELFIPLEQQKKCYKVKSSVPLKSDTLELPCGPDEVMVLKE